MEKYICQLEISGKSAMWTRPDTGDSPVSYPVPTPSAVKGIFESILRLKNVNLVPLKAEICAPITYHPYTTNYGGPLRKSKVIQKGAGYQLLATVLTNVCYRLYALPKKASLEGMDISEKAKLRMAPVTNPNHAYYEIFNRRISKGQFYAMPCLGWKEFVPEYVGPFRADTKPCYEINETISSMLWEMFSVNGSGIVSPVFRQNVKIINGGLNYVE
ncbi:MAG TPA: CRISPR-associated protein Cas5 [Elusimicrobia bacterium]|nr:CRISPR-associated protein Cas5 [Elusimicrobiota bacterium]